MKVVNIVIKYNKKHIAATHALLGSIVENKNKESKYCIWINVKGMDPEQKALKALQSDTVHIGLFTDDSELKSFIQKAVYLEWNTIVQGDLSDLYEFDMKGNAIAETLNIPDVISHIPVSAEKYNRAVKLVDFSIKAEEPSMMELPVYYNMAYDQILQYPESYDKEKLREMAGLEKLDMNKLKKKAVILRYSEDYSPEQYFDHPYTEQWTKYLSRSKYDMTELESRKSYQETLGNQITKKDAKNRVPVTFYFENNETAYAVALIKSISANLREDRKLDFRILHHAVSEENKKILLQMNSDKVNIALHDVKLDKRERAVLLLPQIFPDCEKVIWLNCKMLCYGDISDLFALDISDKYLCAASGKLNSKKADEVSIADEICLENTVYPDMSVVLINVQKWISEDIAAKIQYLLKNKRGWQKAVYTVCKSHIGRLSHKWNYSEKRRDEDTYLNQCRIYNYMNELSPWMNENGTISENLQRYLQLHPEYEKLKDEILKYESGEEDVKEVMEKIERLEKQNADLVAEKNALKQQNELLQKQNEILDQEKGQFLYELLETRKSFTYKVGRFITFIPRHLRGEK